MKKTLLILILGLVLVSGCKFLQQEEYCYLKEKEGLVISEEMKQGLSISEAKEIAVNSECGDRLKETYICNEDTGSWWIDLDIEKEGCDPACVVYVLSKRAEINWRCTGVTFCAKEGELLKEPDEYCCEGLKEWSIPDTRLSIADICYEVGQPSKIQMRMCIKCGDGICENHLMYDENPCNCPEDCKGKNKSHFQSIEEFCQSNDWNISLSKACEETFKDSPICGLC